MALSNSLLFESKFQCSVCLEVFTDPVSTPCGHSFCRACLSSYWDGKDERQCPMCLKTFRDPLDLSVNVILAQITQDYMKSLKLPQPCSEPTKEPSCDICKEGSKKRAAKMCLPCYTSFCDDHVRSHPADHKLLDTHFEDKRVCEKHNQPLELFCSTDQTCICTLCAEAHHERHSTVPIEREWTLRCTELRKAVLEEKQLILGRQKKVQDIKQRVELSRRDSEKKQEEGLQVLAILLSYIEKCRAEFVEVIKERQRAAESRAESLVEELEQEIVELKKRNTTLKQLLSLEDHAHVLQSFPSQHTPFISKDWDAIIVNTDPCLGTVGSVFCPLEETIRKTVSKLMDAEFNKIKQHKIDVTMDPDTAHKYLSVTNSGKRVSLNPYSRRFAHDYFVQGEQLFSSGRHYWEVEVGEKTSWQLGVALESIDCREKLALSPQKDVWLLQLSSGKNLKGLTNPAVQLSPISLPRTVGVYVDYEEGQVSFYDVEAKSHLFSFTGITFTKGLCPIFSPGHIDKTPLIISSVAKPNKVWRFDLDD